MSVFKTVFEQVQSAVGDIAPLEWHKGKPTMTPIITYEPPKSVKWDTWGDGSKTAEAPLTIHYYSETMLSTEEPVEIDAVSDHESSVDDLVNAISCMECIDEDGNVIAYNFNLTDSKPGAVEGETMHTVLVFNAEWINRAMCKTYTKIRPGLTIDPQVIS